MKRILAVCVALTLLCAASLDAQKRAPAKRPPQARKAAAPAKPAPPPSAPKIERPVPFKPGESLSYDVSWSSFLTAGTATLTVRQKKPSYNSVAYYIVAEGQPTSLLSRLYSLYYKADTLLDVYTLLPQRGSVFSQENSRQRMKTTLFNQPARTIHYEMRTTQLLRQDKPIPANTQDALSAIYQLRSMTLRPGMTATMPISDSGTTYTARFTVGQAESVKTGVGYVQALKVTPVITDPNGQSIGRGMIVWISTDGRRLPVKMTAQLKVGSFNLTLREMKAGTVAGR